MSPLEPRVGPQFERALERMQAIASLKVLQAAIYIAANNRYGTFERQGPLRFGVLDEASYTGWAGKPEIHFCFIERGGTFFFMHAQEWPYEEIDKKARAFRAQGLR